MTILKHGDTIQYKLEICGLPAVYSRHAPNHSADVSRFLKLSTRKAIRSRDPRFLATTFLRWARDTGYDLSQQENLANDYDTVSEDDSAEQYISNEIKATTTGIKLDDDYDDDYKDGPKNIDNINLTPDARNIDISNEEK